MPKIAVLVGSIRRDSINRKLAQALVKLGEGKFEPIWVRIDDLPLFSQDDEKAPTPAVTRMKNEIASADGILFVTPEHNRSVPAALKNAIDWCTRPYGTSVLAGKPCAVAGTAQGLISAAIAQTHLKSILLTITGGVLGQPECYIRWDEKLIDADDNIPNESTRKFLSGYVERMVSFVAALAKS
ncbi:MAG TPA: NAD(P)H-dependent oxidoreductase [Myxococcota bacterium]|nr:NAD(P)H-dependent oxidoreductase [Myxococcota bacterium]